MTDDLELLRKHVEHGSEEAFRELVERHARMVYGTALRVLGDAALAEEVSQAVFVLLARKAPSIRASTVLAGWLYRTARFVSLEALRAERRRKERYERLAEMNDSSDPVWPKMAPSLEDAMARLGTTDRDAVVLRFFENKTFAEVAATMGTTEPAAKMRVGRALERLRTALAREGVAASGAVLAILLAANAAPTIPAGLSASISSAALAGGAVSQQSLAALVKGALKIMAWNKVRNIGVAVALILLAGGGGAFVAWRHGVIQHLVALRHGTAQQQPIVRTFEPMAGNWEGTFEMRGDDLPEPTRERAALNIRTTQQGRSCHIEMRMLGPNGGAVQVWHFTHALTEKGDRIITMDDPHIARPLGEGVVTESVDDRATGEWRAAFVATVPSDGGSMDCQWSRRGDELIILRNDKVPAPGGMTTKTSELRLQRAAERAKL